MINVRRKGLNYEREVVNKLRSVFECAERSQEGDSLDRAGIDIKGTGKLKIQCKRNRNYAPITKIEEVNISNGFPCLVTKGDRKRSVICLYLDDFIKILKDIGEVYDDDSFRKRQGTSIPENFH